MVISQEIPWKIPIVSTERSPKNVLETVQVNSSSSVVSFLTLMASGGLFQVREMARFPGGDGGFHDGSVYSMYLSSGEWRERSRERTWGIHIPYISL